MNKPRVQSAYFPVKRKTSNYIQMQQMLKAKLREYRLGTQHKIELR